MQFRWGKSVGCEVTPSKRLKDNSEQIADNRRLEVWASWVECGSIGWCGDLRKSGSFAPALKSRSWPRPGRGRCGFAWLGLS
jgi:hypothetical protein